MTKFEPLAESEWMPESEEYRYLNPVGSSVPAVPSVPSDTPPVETVADVLRDLRAQLGRYICVMDDLDLDLLTLWTFHTHLAFETYSTPRLQIDSTMPGSGKTTVLEHLSRYCLNPIQAASLSSPRY